MGLPAVKERSTSPSSSTFNTDLKPTITWYPTVTRLPTFAPTNTWYPTAFKQVIANNTSSSMPSITPSSIPTTNIELNTTSPSSSLLLTSSLQPSTKNPTKTWYPTNTKIPTITRRPTITWYPTVSKVPKPSRSPSITWQPTTTWYPTPTIESA